MRPTTRIAWRQARRAPWRTLLVVATVTLPVAALTLGLVFIRTGMPTPAERAVHAMGSADMAVSAFFESPTPRDVRRIRSALPPGSAMTVRRTIGTETVFGGALFGASVDEWAVPVDADPVRGLYALLDGSLPHRRGEAAVHPDLLAAAGSEIGGEIRLRMPDPRGGTNHVEVELRVTGTIELPRALDQMVAVAGPGTLKGMPARVDLILFDLPDDLAPEALVGLEEVLGTQEAGGNVQHRELAGLGEETARLVANAVALGGTALALFGTGLVAAAAFVVGARRQLRALGLVGATGGEPRQVRRVVLMGGLVLGIAGSVVGVAVGLALAIALFPLAEQVANQRLGALEIPWLWLAGGAALGTLAATLAAFGPARAAAKLSPVDALAGRPAPPRPAGRTARRGLILLLAGTAVTGGTTMARSIPGIIAGLLMMIGGFLLAIPLVASWTGRLGGRLPATLRLAARDVSRHGRRTGAALAAATMVLALPVAVSALTLSEEASRFGGVPPMADDHLVLNLTPQTTRDAASEQADLVDAMRRAVPGALIAPVRQAVYPPGHPDAPPEAGGSLGVFVRGPDIVARPGVAFTASGPLLVGGADLLRALHAEEGIDDLAGGKVVGIGPEGVTSQGTVSLQPLAGNAPSTHLPAVTAGETRFAAIGFWGEFLYVVSRERAADLGFRAQGRPPEGYLWVLRAPEALTPAQVRAAQAAAITVPGGYANTLSNYGRTDSTLRLVMTGVAALIALAIVGVVVALVTAESRRDHAVLVAVGAGPWMRRKVVGANAWLLATLGGLLAVPAGFAPVIVIQMARQAGRTVVVPWFAIAVAAAALPLIAGIVSAAVSRQPRAAQLLRPIA